MNPFVVAAARFILVHSLAGQPVELNVAQITSLAPPKKHGVLAPSGCVIHMANGIFVSTREACAEIDKLITRQEPA
jgi:hypothetical protein